jgi:hypothetical protein
MPVPQTSIPTLTRTRPWLAWLFVLVTLPAFAARGTEPQLRIPLEPLGFQPLSAQLLIGGSSMLTLHYVDDKHLLITFVVHRLIPRLPGEPEDDQDRVVDAVLVEISTGKALSRTTWHLHDRGQYLWNLGHGHFLLRIRDSLSTVAPLVNLSTSEPFVQRPLLDSSGRRLAAVILSPDNDLLIVESLKRKPPAPKRPAIFGPDPSAQPSEREIVQVNFYRIHVAAADDAIQASPAGAVQTRGTGDIPASTAGYLTVIDQGHQHWAFDFHSYAGKTAELSPFDSSCSPAPLFVSHGEFIAFGCRGGAGRQQIGGFNMRGEEMWEQGLFGNYASPSIAFAPAGGRFALSRVLLKTSFITDQPISPDEINAQTVVVYQIGSGKQLLRVDCAPVALAGQNFTLSPDGLTLAIVHADAIEIYNLPPLTTKDTADIKLAQSFAPAENNLPIRLNGHAEPSPDEAANSDIQHGTQPSAPQPAMATQPATPPATPTDTAAAAPQPQPAQPAPQPTQPEPQSAQPKPAVTDPPTTPAQPSGDPASGERRAPPTLYTLPGDKPPDTPQKPTPQ